VNNYLKEIVLIVAWKPTSYQGNSETIGLFF